MTQLQTHLTTESVHYIQPLHHHGQDQGATKGRQGQDCKTLNLPAVTTL